MLKQRYVPQQSPEFFSLSFQNQDLFYAELESLKDAGIFDVKLGCVNDAIRKLVFPEKILFHLEDTHLDNLKMLKIIATIERNSAKFQKLAIVGVHSLQKIKLIRKMNKANISPNLHWKIINDFQAAKEWIVSPQIK